MCHNRREFVAGATATIATVCLAGCTGGGDTDDGGAGDGSNDDGGAGGGSSGDGGAATPVAAVETYIEAGQDGDSDAMAAVVHPDGSAPTSPDADGGSMGDISVNSIELTDESDGQASVTADLELTVSQDGEEQSTSFETVYEVRTSDGRWYVHSMSGGV